MNWDYRKKKLLLLYLGSIVGKDLRLPSVLAVLKRQKPSEPGLKSKHPLGNWGDGEIAGVRYEDDDEIARAFGEDQSDFQNIQGG